MVWVRGFSLGLLNCCCVSSKKVNCGLFKITVFITAKRWGYDCSGRSWVYVEERQKKCKTLATWSGCGCSVEVSALVDKNERLWNSTLVKPIALLGVAGKQHRGHQRVMAGSRPDVIRGWETTGQPALSDTTCPVFPFAPDRFEANKERQAKSLAKPSGFLWKGYQTW